MIQTSTATRNTMKWFDNYILETYFLQGRLIPHCSFQDDENRIGMGLLMAGHGAGAGVALPCV